MLSMWVYYAGVVVVGIGFLTLGILWTILGLTILLGLIFGIRCRTQVSAKFNDIIEESSSFLFHKRKPSAKLAGANLVEETDRRWLFPDPNISDIRRESFDALSEGFLLLKRLVPYQSAALFEYDMETRLAYPRLYSTGSEVFRKDGILSVSDGVVGYCLSSGKVVHYADFKGDARLLGYYAGPEDIRSVLVLPLDRGDRRLGALVVDSATADVFSSRMDEIRHLSGILSELLVRVQREESILMRVEEDRTLKAMTERMAKSGVSIEEVAESLCRLARDVFPADRVTFVVFDEADGAASGKIPFSRVPVANPSIVRFRSLKMIDRYVELVARTQKTIRLDDIWENGLLSLATGQSGLTTRSMLAAPFVFESQVVGVVVLEADRRRAFNAFHETAVCELVLHAATAVARAIEYGRMERTCAIADAVASAADSIFATDDLGAALENIQIRFPVLVDVMEIQADKNSPVGVRPWSLSDGGYKAPSPVQLKSIESAGDFVRVDGVVTSVRDVRQELPAGSDVVFALTASPGRAFGVLCVSVRAPLPSETLWIFERIRLLLQIRLVLERRERQFGFLKIRDPLTGILHTAAFEKKMEESLRRAKDEGSVFHFLLLQPGRMLALKRTHGFSESVRRYASLCSEIERLAGPQAIVGRVGAEDIGVICREGAESMRAIKTQIERLSDVLGFQIQVTCAEGSASTECVEALIESAADAGQGRPSAERDMDGASARSAVAGA